MRRPHGREAEKRVKKEGGKNSRPFPATLIVAAGIQRVLPYIVGVVGIPTAATATVVVSAATATVVILPATATAEARTAAETRRGIETVVVAVTLTAATATVIALATAAAARLNRAEIVHEYEGTVVPVTATATERRKQIGERGKKRIVAAASAGVARITHNQTSVVKFYGHFRTNSVCRGGRNACRACAPLTEMNGRYEKRRGRFICRGVSFLKFTSRIPHCGIRG